MRQLAAEITREKLFLQLHQELPYRPRSRPKAGERKDGSVRIEQVIYVERDSQRKIVLGKGGATIKAIGDGVAQGACGNPREPVHLFLFVKVRENWATIRSATAKWDWNSRANDRGLIQAIKKYKPDERTPQRAVV